MAVLDLWLMQDPWTRLPSIDRSKDPWGFLLQEKVEDWANHGQVWEGLARRGRTTGITVRVHPQGDIPGVPHGTTREALHMIRQLQDLGYVGGEVKCLGFSRKFVAVRRAKGSPLSRRIMSVMGEWHPSAKNMTAMKALPWVNEVDCLFPLPPLLPYPDKRDSDTHITRMTLHEALMDITRSLFSGCQVYPGPVSGEGNVYYVKEGERVHVGIVPWPRSRKEMFLTMLDTPGMGDVDAELMFTMMTSYDGWFALCRGYSYWRL